jgi:NAD(P)-dependent dehydrogenase (short-subunit alcohol dehydrogenase family)
MKTALVTGASYGIGKSITQLLLQQGWKVYGLSRTKPNFADNQLVWVECDLSKASQIEQALKTVSEPTLDALISNAGIFIEEAASAVSVASYEKTFSVNLLAPMLIVQGLRDKIRHATIISVSSVSDRLPEPHMALYCSSKAANSQYFDALAQDLSDAKVYVLLPDYVDTPMLRSSPPDTHDFNWEVIIPPSAIASLSLDLITGHITLDSGTNIIIVTNALKESLTNTEKLYGFNTDTSELIKL